MEGEVVVILSNPIMVKQHNCMCSFGDFQFIFTLPARVIK